MGKVMTLFLAALLSMATVLPVFALAQGGASLVFTPPSMDPGASQTVALTVQNVPEPGVAGFDIVLTYNAAVVSISLGKGSEDLGKPVVNAGNGALHLAAAQATGKTGNLTLADLIVQAVGQAGQTSPIFMTARLVGQDLKEIPVTLQNGSVSIKGSATSSGGGGGTLPGGGTGAQPGSGELPWDGHGDPNTQPVQDEHFAGKDRFDTARLIAQGAYPGPNQATVFVANAYAPADALAGAPLAYKSHAPLLLGSMKSDDATALADYIHSAVSSQGRMVLLGSTAVLDSSYQSGWSLQTDRVGGANREETAVQIAKELIGNTTGIPVVVVNNNGFADAVSIAPIAAQMGWPILLTNGETLSKATANFLETEQPAQILVIGGKSVVSEGVYSALANLSPSIQRVSGADRFGTNAEVLKKFAGQAKGVAFASGDGDYPIDALAGAALGIPIVLVHDRTDLNPAQQDFLHNLGQVPSRTFGGSGVIKQDISW